MLSTDTTTIDLNEPMEILVSELRKSGVRKHTCINDMGYSQLERNIVEQLTTWQKEKDKQTIDKLIEQLKIAIGYIKRENVCSLPEMEELLNTIQKENE